MKAGQKLRNVLVGFLGVVFSNISRIPRAIYLPIYRVFRGLYIEVFYMRGIS